MTGIDSASDEYADNLKIAERFFLKTYRSGFLFAVCNDELVQREVNSTLQFLLLGKGKTLYVHTWQKGDEAVHPLEQLRLLKKSVPNLAGFILAGLDSALLQNTDLLVQLNFGREALSELGIPILFWLSTRTLRRISNEAIDLYNQRVGANLYFEQAAETTDTDNAARRYVAQETVRSNDNIRYLEARMKLLQQQLDEAEQQQRDPVVIANEIVLELLHVYNQIPGTAQLMQSLIDCYLSSFDLEKPENCAIVANAFKCVGEVKKALDLYEIALKKYRELAETNPQTYLPYVAMSLNSLALLQSEQRNYVSADAHYQEALKIYRKLISDSRNKIYLADTAIVLNNLANLHLDQKDYSSAVIGYKTGLNIYRALAERNPKTYLPDVAMILNNLSNLLQGQNNFSAAIEGYEEVLKIYRELSCTNLTLYQPDIAMTLINLGGVYYQPTVSDKEKSLECVKEALQILLPLVKNLPDAKNHVDIALQVIKDWGIDPEEFVKQLAMHE